ncbi:MAG: hypothetical protein RL026_1917 [Pseudomonadota bacterium]
MSTHPLDSRGLSHSEAAGRLAEHGYNDLPTDVRRGWLSLAAEVLAEPMFALLLGAALVYALLGDHLEAAVLCGFATVSVGITLIQRGRSQRVLDTLRDLSSPRALVLREGALHRIPGREVVPGDLAFLAEGDRIPADGLLQAGSGLDADESLLTGESLPVAKQAGDAVYSGTLVVRGNGTLRVGATGIRSEIGRIGAALRATPQAVPRLQAETAQLVRFMGAAGLLVSLAVLALEGLGRGNWLEGLLGGIAVGMSMLPEEFPLVLTVFMVMGAWRLSASRVLTRRAAAIETLGAATVLCTDKTGTLTHNRISVASLQAAGGLSWQAGEAADVLQQAGPLRQLLRAAQGASLAEAQDPIDSALLQLPGGTSDPGSTGPDAALIDYPLRPGSPLLGRAWRRADGVLRLCVKGAPEHLLSLCALDGAERAAALAEVEHLGSRGGRVLAVGEALLPGDEPPASLAEAGPLRYLGLVVLADPVRESVPAAMAECRAAGMRVVMITGDHPHTARAIARDAGIAAGEVLTGPQLEALNDIELAACIRGVTVFARITPGQKLRIVEALKAAGEVVAMTGDGVNDSPALKAADIGVAMGSRGCDVAREASALVLLEDDFGALVRAVRIGRRIYDNLRKAMVYILAVHVPIAGIALLPLLFGQPLLLTPMIIALLEIIIDPTCSVVLEAEPEERNVMARPPRDPRQRMLAWPVLRWSLAQGLSTLLLVAGVLLWSQWRGASAEALRGVALLALVGANLVLMFVNRGLDGSTRGILHRHNTAYWVVTGLIVTLTTALLAWPPLQGFMDVTAPDAAAVGACVASTALLFLLLQGVKGLRPPAAWR